MLVNYERYICNLFGEKHSLGTLAAIYDPVSDITTPANFKEAVAPLPSTTAKYLEEFDAALTDQDINSPYFRRRFLFVPVIASKMGPG